MNTIPIEKIQPEMDQSNKYTFNGPLNKSM